MKKLSDILEHQVLELKSNYSIEDAANTKFDFSKDFAISELRYFTEMVHKYCFVPPPENSHNNFYYVPDEFSELFIDIFFEGKKLDLNGFYTEYLNSSHHWPYIEGLYLNLLYYVYHQNLISLRNIDDIFSECLNQWNKFIKENILSVKIYTYLPEVFIDIDEIINLGSNLYLKSFDNAKYIYVQGNLHQESSTYLGLGGSFIILDTDLKSNHSEPKIFLVDDFKID